MNFELPAVQAGFTKGRKPDIKLPTYVGSLKKAGVFQKNVYFFLINYAKAFECVDHRKLSKFFKRREYKTT